MSNKSKQQQANISRQSLDNNTQQQLQNLLNQAMDLQDNAYLRDPVPLPEMGSWPQSVHRIDKQNLLAIVAAVSAGRPLLLRGEPGVGKSHLARAAAQLLHRHFISTIIQPRTDYQELLWHIDHTARLGKAQLLAALQAKDAKKTVNKEKVKSDGSDLKIHKTDLESTLDIQHFISPGPLWWAYDWHNAQDWAQSQSHYQAEAQGQYSAEKNGVVLLIDEIDKADLSLSNGLLEVLGNGSFYIPPLDLPVRGSIAPLVIITSNDSRELPKAFMRRCVVHELNLPRGEELIKHFQAVGKAQFPELADDVINLAAERIIALRNKAEDHHQLRTGQAEFVDLLRALNRLPAEQQQDSCAALVNFFSKLER